MRVEEIFEHFNSKYEAEKKLNSYGIEVKNSPITPNEMRDLQAMMKRVQSHIDRGSFSSARKAFSRMVERGFEYGVDSQYMTNNAGMY